MRARWAGNEALTIDVRGRVECQRKREHSAASLLPDDWYLLGFFRMGKFHIR